MSTGFWKREGKREMYYRGDEVECLKKVIRKQPLLYIAYMCCLWSCDSGNEAVWEKCDTKNDVEQVAQSVGLSTLGLESKGWRVMPCFSGSWRRNLWDNKDIATQDQFQISHISLYGQHLSVPCVGDTHCVDPKCVPLISGLISLGICFMSVGRHSISSNIRREWLWWMQGLLWE